MTTRSFLYDAYENGEYKMTGTVGEIADAYFLSPVTVGYYRYRGTWLRLVRNDHGERPVEPAEPNVKRCRTCANMTASCYCVVRERTYSTSHARAANNCSDYVWDGYGSAVTFDERKPTP